MQEYENFSCYSQLWDKQNTNSRVGGVVTEFTSKIDFCWELWHPWTQLATSEPYVLVKCTPCIRQGFEQGSSETLLF